MNVNYSYNYLFNHKRRYTSAVSSVRARNLHIHTIDNRRSLNLTLRKKKKKNITMIKCEHIFGIIKFSSNPRQGKVSSEKRCPSILKELREPGKISYEINVIPFWVHILAVFTALISVAVSAFLPRFKSGRLKREDSASWGKYSRARGRETRREMLPLAILRVMPVCVCVCL